MKERFRGVAVMADLPPEPRDDEARLTLHGAKQCAPLERAWRPESRNSRDIEPISAVYRRRRPRRRANP